MMQTGVIGLGAMGSGMATNLRAVGRLTAVYNRTYQTAAELGGALGVTVADDPATVAALCDVVVTCVSRDEDVLEVVDAICEGIDEGKIVCDCSTTSVDTAKEAARRLAEKGAHFLDCPVSGGKEGAQKGQLMVMVGGDGEVLSRAYDALDAFAKGIVHMGPVGSGQATKAVNQIMAAGINQAVTEALAFGQSMGLDMERVISVVGNGAAGNWFVNHRGMTMTQDLFEPGFKVALHHKDLSICKQMLEQQHVALPLVEMTLKHYQRLMEQGHGDEDISALYRLKKAMFAEGGNKKSL